MGQQPGIQQPGMVQPGMGQQVMSTSGTQMGMMQQGGAPMMTTAGTFKLYKYMQYEL